MVPSSSRMATTQGSVSQPQVPQQHQVAQGSQGSLQQGQAQQQQRRLVLVVEGTAGLGPYWPLLRSEYIDKLTRAFCGQDANGQVAVTPGEMALVVFCSHGSYSGCLLQYSGWTSSLDVFSQWLSSIDFAGGGFGEVAIAEGLAQALMMCCPGQSSPPMTQPIQRHCVLVAASNPHRLQTPVPHPPINISTDSQPDHWWLADADTVAKAFPQCHVSLSIVCPRQLPSLKEIYYAGRRNARADPAADIPKHAQHLVLLSESFLEARASLRRATPAVTAVTTASTPPLPSTVKVEQVAAASTAPATGQIAPMVVGTTTSAVPTAPTTAPSRQVQAMSSGTMSTPSVKIEHGSVITTFGSSSMSNSNVAAIPLPMQSSAPPTVSAQDGLRPPPSTDAAPGQDFKSIASNPLQGHRPGGTASILNSVSHIRHNPGALPLGTGSTPALSVSNMLSAGVGSGPLIAGQGGLGITQPAPNSAGFGGATGVGHAVTNTVGGVQANGTASTNILPSNTNGLAQPVGNANGNLPAMQSMVGLGQGMQPGGSLAPGAQISQTGLGVSHGALSGQGSAVGSTGTAAMMPTPGISQPIQPVQNSNTSGASANLASTAVATPPQSTGNNAKYTKLWQGVLAGQRQGKPVPICNLEGYRQTSSPETLAADWPPTMQIVRLIPQDYMNSKEYQGKAELLVFRPLSQHGFLSQLAEKKLCAVIQLPSQTLLLASADKPQRMIGMLFPGDMVVFKPQVASSQQQGSTAGPSFAQGQLPGQQNRPQMMPNSQALPGTGPQIMSNSQSTGFLP